MDPPRKCGLIGLLPVLDQYVYVYCMRLCMRLWGIYEGIVFGGNLEPISSQYARFLDFSITDWSLNQLRVQCSQ